MTGYDNSPEKETTLHKIADAKQRLGKDVLILAHFYQSDDIVRFADFVGDSLQLAQAASQHKEARYIVFCSVSFMAETAHILCSPEQEVLHPEPQSRCPLADMAARLQVETAWERISMMGTTIIPVVYVNSNADLKAFCAKNDGMVCTSANVKSVFERILSGKASLFFFPDENMGRNICRDLGISGEAIYLWDPDTDPAEFKPEAAGRVKVFLWKGFCAVHNVMGAIDIERLRREHEDIRIIVHPECTPDVYNLADFAGSTSFIRTKVEASAAGSRWAIGTEWNFVNRIKTENPDKLIVPLREERCRDMSEVTPEKLLRVLEGILDGRLPGRVMVDRVVADEARIALQRMLEIS